jgi:hypothetical protein
LIWGLALKSKSSADVLPRNVRSGSNRLRPKNAQGRISGRLCLSHRVERREDRGRRRTIRHLRRRRSIKDESSRANRDPKTGRKPATTFSSGNQSIQPDEKELDRIISNPHRCRARLRFTPLRCALPAARKEKPDGKSTPLLTTLIGAAASLLTASLRLL